MATFPSLIPSTRTYSPGEFPSTPHPTYSGSQVRVRHSNAVMGAVLRLFFPALTTAEMLEIKGHYAGQRGRFVSFDIPNEVLSGTDNPADFTPAGQRWRYANRPQVLDISVDGDTPSNFHDVTVELVSAPEKAAIYVPRSVFRMQALAPEVVGTPSSVDVPLVTYNFSALAPTVEAVASDGVNFADVSLLLPFDGSNGSTTFTDESNNAYTVTAFGNAQISTAQSQWGGSSLLLDGSGDYATITSPPANLREWWTDTFQIDAWVRVANFTVRSAAGSSVLVGHMEPTTGTQYWSFGPVNSGTIRFYYFNGAVENVSSSSTITLNTWHHIRFTHDSGTLRIFVDGSLDASASIVDTPFTPSGEPFTIGMCENVPFDGYVDDLRIVRGGVVSTASFTPPAGPFPTS